MRVGRRRSSLASLAVGCIALAACNKARTGPPGALPVEAIGPAQPPSGASGTPAANAEPSSGRCRGVALPADQHYAAPGTCARMVASAQGPLREIMFAPNGTSSASHTTESSAATAIATATACSTRRPTRSSTGPGRAATRSELRPRRRLSLLRLARRREALEVRPDDRPGGDGENVVVGQPGGGNHPLHPLHVYDHVLYATPAPSETSSGRCRRTTSPIAPSSSASTSRS